MAVRVVLTHDAERDLEDIYRHIAQSDSPASADRVLDRLLAVMERLAAFPQRGSVPGELQHLGIRDYRQMFSGPYRAIGGRAVIYLVADGRRDLQSLLARRLLGD
jgi:toxin ParE1/3/4